MFALTTPKSLGSSGLSGNYPRCISDDGDQTTVTRRKWHFWSEPYRISSGKRLVPVLLATKMHLPVTFLRRSRGRALNAIVIFLF
jgi:hypothetical protein